MKIIDKRSALKNLLTGKTSLKEIIPAATIWIRKENYYQEAGGGSTLTESGLENYRTRKGIDTVIILPYNNR